MPETKKMSEIQSELEALMTGFWLTDLANFSAFVFHEVQALNWAGFYLSDGKCLRLGPFCGRPACTEIDFRRGVCGDSFRRGEILIVDDVHRYPGHISCDSNSRSELVIPFRVAGQVLGVFDLDSPILSRFSLREAERVGEWLGVLSEKNFAFKGLEHQH